MSKVIQVRLELKHEYEGNVELLRGAMEYTTSLWEDELDSWSVEVVNEDPA